MTTFRSAALLITAIWAILVIVRFQRSSTVLVGGLFAIAIYTFVSFLYGKVTADELGLGMPESRLSSFGFAIAGLLVLLVYSPLADRLATRFIEEPPTLDAFDAIQESKGKLVTGIIAAWVLGGMLEELIVRGIVLLSVEAMLSVWITRPWQLELLYWSQQREQGSCMPTRVRGQWPSLHSFRSYSGFCSWSADTIYGLL